MQSIKRIKHKRIKTILLGLVISLLLIACKKDTNNNRITSLVTTWQDKKIIFPENLVFTLFATDTVNYQIPRSKYKVLVYTDSTGCTSCKLQLTEWKKFIHYTDSITQGKIPFLFFFQPMDRNKLHSILIENAFKYPINIDTNNQFYLLNLFPNEIMFQSFLLDHDNNVVVIGNPIHNLKVKSLYLKKIFESKEMENPFTFIETKYQDYDIGNIKKGQSVDIQITIHNKGLYPFKLKGFTYSCDCTKASADWTELQSGESRDITIHYKAEQIGDFIRTVEIYGNIPDTFILNLMGTVI